MTVVISSTEAGHASSHPKGSEASIKTQAEFGSPFDRWWDSTISEAHPGSPPRRPPSPVGPAYPRRLVSRGGFVPFARGPLAFSPALALERAPAPGAGAEKWRGRGAARPPAPPGKQEGEGRGAGALEVGPPLLALLWLVQQNNSHTRTVQELIIRFLSGCRTR